MFWDLCNEENINFVPRHASVKCFPKPAEQN